MSKHKQRYELGEKHLAFLRALHEEGGEQLSVHVGTIALRSGLPPNSVRRLTEGLTNHGYIDRRGSGRYRLTEKGAAAVIEQDTEYRERRELTAITIEVSLNEKQRAALVERLQVTEVDPVRISRRSGHLQINGQYLRSDGTFSIFPR